MTVMRSINFYFAPLTRSDAALLAIAGAVSLIRPAGGGERTWSGHVAQRIASSLGVMRASPFPSARAALYALLRSMEIGPGDEVLMPAFTCVAVPNAVRFTGATPVFVDIVARTFNLNPDAVAGAVTHRTRAVLAQHTFGNPIPIDRLRASLPRDVKVIEDCCLALGSRWHGRPVGSFGDAGILSFELSKTLTAGWGGVAWARDPDCSARLDDDSRRLPAAGGFAAARAAFQVSLSYWLYHPEIFGRGGRLAAGAAYRAGVFRVSTPREETRGEMPAAYQRRLSDDHWRIIAGQIDRFDEHERNAAITARYHRVLMSHGVHTFPLISDHSEPQWIRYPFLVENRAAFTRFFAAAGIEIGHWFDSPISGAQSLEAYGYTQGTCPVAERVTRHVVNLPTHARLSEGDVVRITERLDAYFIEQRATETKDRHKSS